MSDQPDEQIIVIRNSREAFGDPDMQVFTDQAITDPVRLAETEKKSRRPIQWPRWFWRLLFAGSVTVALGVGILLGRFVL
jgi:hypothetical protein